MRIALFGQAPFGAAVYERLRADGQEIVGVFGPPERTRPDPLAEAARRDGVTLAQPVRWQRKGVADAEVVAAHRSTRPDLNVMAFVTQIIPEEVLDQPRHGTIQYHPSLLPRHRGRSAINHALLQGDAETGLTIFWVDRGIDTGPILLQKRFAVGENDTVNSLYRERFFPLGVEALAEAVTMVRAGTAPRMTQDEAAATYEGPWEGDIAHIDFSRPATEVHNLIRGSDRQPGAWTTIEGVTVRLYGSRRVEADEGEAGSVAGVTEAGLAIRCGTGAVRVETVMAEGRAREAAAVWATAAGVGPGARCR